MKRNDIVPLTVVYAAVQHSTRHQAVVLDTGRWRARYARGRHLGDTRLAGYGRDSHSYGSYSAESGLLLLQVGGVGTAAQIELPDTTLLALAAPALAVIEAGGLPELPPGVRVRIARPQDIDTTWVEHWRRGKAIREIRARKQREEQERKAAQAAARARITSVVGERPSLRYSPPQSWTELEQVCRAYADAVIAATPTPIGDPS